MKGIIHIRRLLCTALSAAVVLSVCGCGNEDSVLSKKENLLTDHERSSTATAYDFTSGEDIIPENYDIYADNVTDFSLRLFRASVSDKENSALACTAVVNTLSLLMNGASSNSAKQLKSCFANGIDIQTLNVCNHYLSSRLGAFNTEESGYYEEHALWFDDRFDVKAAFLQNSVNYYTPTLARTVLTNDDTAEKINTVTNEKLHTTAQDFTLDSLEDMTTLGVSAACIHDLWATSYTEHNLSEGTFHGTNSDSAVTFMTSTEYYISSSYAEGFIKGLKNTPVKFAAFMPTEDMPLSEFAEIFTTTRLQALLDSTTPTDFCTASIPEFTAETQGTLDEALKTLGITDIFDTDTASFTELSNSENVCFSSLVHRASVTVSPSGTTSGTAAPATASSATDSGHTLVFDRPFVFLFFDNESGIPILIGTVNNI